MNFAVYNTNNLNNFPESGIFSTYRSNHDGETIFVPSPQSLVVDDDYIYYPSSEISYVSKNIQTIAVLNTEGNIIGMIKPNCTMGDTAPIIGNDDNYLYATANVSFNIKDNGSSNNSIFRINKNTYQIDKNFMLGAWYGWNSRYMVTGNNKYYFHSNSNMPYGIYPNLDSNGANVGIYILKNKKNISKLGRITNTFNTIKIKNNDIYVAGRTPHRDAVNSFSKIFKINKNLQIDESFNPIIERLNSTSAVLGGGVSSDVFDFDFDNEGIYIGGNFLTVGGEPRTGIAKIDYSGNLINYFNANLSATNNTSIVRAVLTTGSGVFVGGAMTNAGGTVGINARIVKLHNDGSRNTAFSGRLNLNNATCLAISGNSLYAGASSNSSFDNVTSGIAKMETESGILDTNFKVNCGTSSDINKILISGSNLYVCGGIFNPFLAVLVGGNISHTASGVIKINSSSGSPDTGFKIDFSPHSFNLTVQDMCIKQNELHIVGNFTGIEGKRINGYAVVDTISGKLLDTYNYFLDSTTIRTINYKLDNDLIILGASSTNPYTSNYNYNYNSRINVFDTGFNLLTGIQFGNIPVLNTANSYNQMLINGTTGYINTGSSQFGSFESTNFIRAYDLENGNLLSTDIFNISGNNSFISMVKYGNNFYLGGYFSKVAGKGFTGNRIGVIKTDINGVIDASFNLNLSGIPVDPPSAVGNLKIIDNNLYILSTNDTYKITAIGSTGINGGLVKYNLLTNSIDTGFNNFLVNQPVVKNVHNDNQNNLYFVLNYNTHNEYTGAGRYFENSGHLFKFDSGSYTPNMNFTSKYFSLTSDIYIDNNKIYAPLRNIGKSISSNIYKINKKTRQILPYTVSIIGGSGAQATTNITSMYGDNNSLYVAGQFSGVNGIPRTGFCKLNKNDLSLDTNFNLNVGLNHINEYISDILETDNYLYLVGNFTRVSGLPYTGLVRINKNNDNWDQNFKVNYSGLNLAATQRNSVISGNKLYSVQATTTNFRVLNLDTASLEFTGNATSVPSTALLYGIENANGNLFILGSTSTTLSDTRLVGGRSRGMFLAGYNTGEIIIPYSVWTNAASHLFAYPKYISANNSIAVSTVSTAAIINNTAQRNTQSIIFMDANKGYIKNKRGINWGIVSPNSSYPSIIQRNKNEIYILYSNYLLNNPEDNLYSFITNTTYTRGILKYDPIKERYDVII